MAKVEASQGRVWQVGRWHQEIDEQHPGRARHHKCWRSFAANPFYRPHLIDILKRVKWYFTIWHPYSAENKLKEKELILVGRQSLTFPRISFIARFYSLLQKDFQWAIPSNFSPVSKMVWIVSTTPGLGRVYVPFLSEKSTIHAMNCIVCISYPMPRLLFLSSEMIGCLVRYIDVDIVPWKTVVK